MLFISCLLILLISITAVSANEEINSNDNTSTIEINNNNDDLQTQNVSLTNNNDDENLLANNNQVQATRLTANTGSWANITEVIEDSNEGAVIYLNGTD